MRMDSAAAPQLAISFRKDRVLDFFRFIAERHLMFIRRVIYRDPPPWTQDPVLASTFTTNVYRELDRGTRYLVRHILPHANAAPADTLWNVLVYRTFNLPATYVMLGGYQPAARWNPSLVTLELERRSAAGLPVFTGAYRVSQRGYPEGWTKIHIVVDRLTRIHAILPALFSRLRAAPSLAQAHRLVAELPGFGEFGAYEIVSDLVYHPALLAFSEDDFVNVGPGAEAALRQMLEEVHSDLFVPAVHDLRWRQTEWFRAAGTVLSGPELTLRNIEHSLCEVQKLWSARQSGRRKRTFTPNEDLSLWDEDLPPEFHRRRFPI
jgi:hypothetical protein